MIQGAKFSSILGVDYTRVHTQDAGALYLTRLGQPFAEHLLPENWYDPRWFEARRIRLEGTSAIYRVPTKPVRGRTLDLVVRFSRVAQELPLPPALLNANPHAEFNSPFEEFALVMQLRNSPLCEARRLLTKRPLGIYVPAKRLREWKTGRLESKMTAKQAGLPEGLLEMSHEYILLYGWIKGLNAVQAATAFKMTESSAAEFLKEATLLAITDLQRRGFRVVDIKPEHVILRIYHDGSLLRRRDGKPAYALVDYELLERVGFPNPNPAGESRGNLCES